ncbi:MAG: hypothetical protein ACI9VR_004055, partial [Cognaticolwellia sp.]
MLLILLSLTACHREADDFNGYTTLSGELSYFSENQDGEVFCDVDLELEGRPYGGGCSDCEFAFHVEPTVIRDDSLEDCVLPSLWAYVDDDFITDGGLGWADSTATFEGLPLDNALMAVGRLDGFGWQSAGVVGDATARTSVDWDGSSLAWSHGFQETAGDSLLVDYECGDRENIDALLEGDPQYSARGDVDCGEATADVYSFEAVAGEKMKFILDTVAAATAMDTMLVINDPGGCSVAESDDAFRCSYDPLEYECAGGSFTPRSTGSYEVVVWGWGACTAPDGNQDGLGDIGEYELRIDA